MICPAYITGAAHKIKSFHINHLSFIDSIYESKKLKKYIKIKNKHEQNK